MGEQSDLAGKKNVWILDLKAVLELEDCRMRIQIKDILD